MAGYQLAESRFKFTGYTKAYHFLHRLVMMTGELEYNDLYYPTSEKIELNMTMANNASGIVQGEIQEETRSMLFPFTPHLLIALFLALVSIVIMNLLFGIAVSDVQDIHKKSKLLQSVQQVDVIDHMENILKRPIFQRLPNNIKKFIMRKLSGQQEIQQKIQHLTLHQTESSGALLR